MFVQPARTCASRQRVWAAAARSPTSPTTPLVVRGMPAARAAAPASPRPPTAVPAARPVLRARAAVPKPAPPVLLAASVPGLLVSVRRGKPIAMAPVSSAAGPGEHAPDPRGPVLGRAERVFPTALAERPAQHAPRMQTAVATSALATSASSGTRGEMREGRGITTRALSPGSTAASRDDVHWPSSGLMPRLCAQPGSPRIVH